MAIHGNASIAVVNVGGHRYPAVTQRNCRTCVSPYREQIETQAVQGHTWAMIINSLPEDAGLSARNLAAHWKNGHVAVHEATVQALADRQAEERGETLGAAVTEAVNSFDFARSLVGRVRHRVANGDLEPNVRDALRAAEFIARYDVDGVPDEEVYLEAFTAYHDTAKTMMTPDDFTEFGVRLEAHPTLRRLVQEWGRRQERDPGPR